jgi:hypothetical protein
MKKHILYDYFGLEVYVEAKPEIPIKIYGNRAQQTSCKTLTFEDGFLKEIINESTTTPLDEIDQNHFNQIIESNVSEIIKNWIDLFVYCKKVQPELIKNRLSSQS